MRRFGLVMLTVVLGFMVLVGCGEKKEEEPKLTQADFQVTDEGKTTRGIGENSTFAEFMAAYPDIIKMVYDGENGFVYKDDAEVKEEDNAPILLASFFVDDVAMTPHDLIQATGKTEDEIMDYICSNEYLDKHHLEYYEMIFEFSEGKVLGFYADSMDYNEEVKYYLEEAGQALEN